MNHESFLDTVTSQYREEIQAALAQCEASWRNGTNFHKLNRMLKKLMYQAKIDGLTQKEFIYLTEQIVPEGLKYLELLGGHAPPEDIRDHLYDPRNDPGEKEKSGAAKSEIYKVTKSKAA